MPWSEFAPSGLLTDREALQLVRAYYAIPEAQRRQIFELARVLSAAETASAAALSARTASAQARA